MSAFVVHPEVINETVAWLRHDASTRQMFSGQPSTLGQARDAILELGWDVEDLDDCRELAEAMFEMNVSAVLQRYPNDTRETAPGYDANQFAYRPAGTPEAVEAMKHLECWHYQCSEGDIPDQPMYRTFEKVVCLIATAIVRSSDAWDNAPWGDPAMGHQRA